MAHSGPRYRCAVHLDNFLSMGGCSIEEGEDEHEADDKKKAHLSVSNANINVASIRGHVCFCNAIVFVRPSNVSNTFVPLCAPFATLTVRKPKNMATQHETSPCMFSASDTLITKSWPKKTAIPTFKWLRGRENEQSPTSADERFHASHRAGSVHGTAEQFAIANSCQFAGAFNEWRHTVNVKPELVIRLRLCSDSGEFISQVTATKWNIVFCFDHLSCGVWRVERLKWRKITVFHSFNRYLSNSSGHLYGGIRRWQWTCVICSVVHWNTAPSTLSNRRAIILI